MNNEQQLIWNYLSQNAMGRINIKTVRQIRAALGLNPGGLTHEYIRTLIRDMVNQHSCLIGSNNRGFWAISSIAEATETIDNLTQRAAENTRRATSIKNTWNTNNPNNTIP